jgi:hypothetical protein
MNKFVEKYCGGASSVGMTKLRFMGGVKNHPKQVTTCWKIVIGSSKLISGSPKYVSGVQKYVTGTPKLVSGTWKTATGRWKTVSGTRKLASGHSFFFGSPVLLNGA